MFKYGSYQSGSCWTCELPTSKLYYHTGPSSREEQVCHLEECMFQAYHQTSIGTTENRGYLHWEGSGEVSFNCVLACQEHCRGWCSFSFQLDIESPRRHAAATSVSLLQRFNKERLIMSMAPSPRLGSWTGVQRKKASGYEQLSPFAP